MIIDSHFHYLSEDFDLDETIRWMNRDGIDKVALMAEICGYFDTDGRAFPMKFMRFLSGKRLLFPILRQSLCTFNTKGVRILGRNVPIYFQPDNVPVFAAAEQHPDRFYAYVTLNPDLQTEEEMIAEAEKYKESPVFCGIKTHPFYHQYNAKKLEPICRILAPLNCPLLIHMGFRDRGPVLHLAKKYPSVNFILAHAAFPFFDAMWPEMAQLPNLYVDISSACYVDAKMARRAVNSLGPHHVIFGTDGPYGVRLDDGSYNFADAYDFATNQLTEDEKKIVSSETFLSLLK